MTTRELRNAIQTKGIPPAYTKEQAAEFAPRALGMLSGNWASGAHSVREWYAAVWPQAADVRKRVIDYALEYVPDVTELIPHDADPIGWCRICTEPLYESDAVRTGLGMAHESCAEAWYGPYDPNRDPGIPKY